VRGTDVNEAQFEAAQDFITKFVTKQPELSPEQTIVIKWDELVRLVAWYGALRAQGIRDRTGGTVEKPGEVALRV